MKKILAFLVIAACVFPVFAQEETEEDTWAGRRRMAVTFSPLDLFTGVLMGGYGFGFGFEYAPIRALSINAHFHYMGFDPANMLFDVDTEDDYYYYDDAGNYVSGKRPSTDISMLRFNIEGRWYPVQKYVEGFYTNLGFQYHVLSADFINSKPSSNLTTIGGYWGIGIKRVTGRERAAFVFEPWLDLAFTTKSEVLDGLDTMSKNLLGWVLGISGIRGGFVIGAAF